MPRQILGLTSGVCPAGVKHQVALRPVMTCDACSCLQCGPAVSAHKTFLPPTGVPGRRAAVRSSGRIASTTTACTIRTSTWMIELDEEGADLRSLPLV